MSVVVTVYTEDITTKLLAYESVKLYRDTSPAGSFATTVSTTALVAGTEAYEIADPSGDANSYYRYTFYHSTGPVESSPSEIFRPDGATLNKIVLEAARQADAGFDGTCSEAGTTATLVDALLRDTGVDTKFLEGAYVYRPNAAAAADKTRRIANDGFTVASGTLAPVRPWTNLPANAEVYQVYAYFPPMDMPGVGYSWARAVREALADTWHVDQLNLGEGTATGQTRFSLAPHASYVHRDSIRRVLLRASDSDSIVTDSDASKNGYYWGVVENAGALSLDIHPAPRPDQTIIVEVNRAYAALYNDADVTECPLALAWKATLWKLYARLNRIQPGKYATEAALAQAEFRAEYARSKPATMVIGA